MKALFLALILAWSLGLQAAPKIDADRLSRAVAERVARVDEFEFIRNEANKMGVRVYLFGGTAAGFAHYVKWDMQREAGDDRFQPDRFDYDYTNIYRTNQDLDIVVDGSSEQADQLEERIRKRFDYVQGRKRSKWEVRLLRDERNGKIALLNNPDFLNQHTDSNSTGMVELTAKDPSDSVRDLRDWSAKRSQFLIDVAEGKIHYYDSPKHETTTYFERGENPPIFSVLRFLTKVFQYELELRPEDEAIIRKKIESFVPSKELANDRARSIFDRLGTKLLQNPVNMEYAFDTIDELGLRKKLEMGVHSSGENSLAWWLQKAPLRSKRVGEGTGRTARELGIDVVAHETIGYTAWESITLAPTGAPNVLESRQGKSSVGEAALYGDGFYTQRGRFGARGTGLTIRFHVDPNAREGTDFILGNAKNFVIMRNKAAFRIIPEGLNIGVADFFEIVARNAAEGNSNSERAIMEKLKRRMAKFNSADVMKPEELARLDKMMSGNGSLRRSFARAEGLATEFFTMPFSRRYRKVLQKLVVDERIGTQEITTILSSPVWSSDRELISRTVTARLKMEKKLQVILTGDEVARLAWLNVAAALPADSIEEFRKAFAQFVAHDAWVDVFFGEPSDAFNQDVRNRGVVFELEAVKMIARSLSAAPVYEQSEFDTKLLDFVLEPLGLETDLEILKARMESKYLSAGLVDWIASIPLAARRPFEKLLFERLSDANKSTYRVQWEAKARAMELLKKTVAEDRDWLETLRDLRGKEGLTEMVEEIVRGLGTQKHKRIIFSYLAEGTNVALIAAMDLHGTPYHRPDHKETMEIMRMMSGSLKEEPSPELTARFGTFMRSARVRVSSHRDINEFLRLSFHFAPQLGAENLSQLSLWRGPMDFSLLDRILSWAEARKAAGHEPLKNVDSPSLEYIFTTPEFAGHPEWIERLARLLGPNHRAVKALLASAMWKNDPRLSEMSRHPLIPWANRAGLGRSMKKGLSLGPVDLCRSIF